jgi:hypothetical protein
MFMDKEELRLLENMFVENPHDEELRQRIIEAWMEGR